VAQVRIKSQKLPVKEKDIERWLALHLDLIEPGLRFICTQAHMNIEVPRGYYRQFARVDILAEDYEGLPVLIEVKAHGIRSPWVIKQLERYMNLWPTICRGIIVGTDIAPELLKEASSKNPPIKFFCIGIGGVPIG